MAISEKTPDIRSEYDPKGQEKEQLEMVYERYRVMKESPDRQEAEKQWDKAAKQWEAHREPKKNWQSNHYVPLTTAIVESALAEMVDQTPRPLILPRSSEDAPKATVMRHIFDYTWEIADGDSQLFNVMKDALIFGTGIAQEYYWQNRRMVKHVEVDKKGKEKTTESEELDYDDCMMEVVKLEDFYVDETARGFDGPYAARDCIRRYIMDIKDFKRFFSGPTWNPLDNAKYVVAGGDTNYYEWYKPPEGTNMENKVEVLWYWNKTLDLLDIVGNDVMVKFGSMPYSHKQLPFARVVDIKRVHRFYGKGESELLESIQDEKNLMRRMILDRNHLDIDKMFIISDTLNLNEEDLIARPHGMIAASGDINAVKPIEYGDIPRSVEFSDNALTDDAISATGIDPRAASAPQPSTATQAALMKESSLKKIRMKLRILEREFLIRIARLRVANIIQFYSQPTLERIVGEKGTKQYQTQIAELQEQGLLRVINKENYAERFRTVRLSDKEMKIEGGVATESPTQGFTFFEAKPEYFIPVAQGGFDLKFGAGATLPVSKPLMQTKVTEMYDRLIQLALGGVGYDPVKLGDALLKVNDFDPEDFKVREDVGAGAEQQMQEVGPDVAGIEHQEFMAGNEIPVNGTPGASQDHTLLHADFMYSPEFQEADIPEERIRVFVRHIMGEFVAQQGRSMGGVPEGQIPQGQSQGGTIQQFQGQGTRANPPQGGGNVNNPLSQIMPAFKRGGADQLL